MSNSTTDWLDTGDNAWQLTAASFVAFQSIPALAILYAGISPRKWSVNSGMMVFWAFSSTLIIWVLYAYKMGFGEQWIPLCGRPGNVLGINTQLSQSTLPTAALTQNFPLATMVYFQFVFAAITVILLAGALLGRMNFLAWALFVPLWITFSYTIGAFSIWGGGYLFQLGVIDYSGGYVIHLSSGTAGFVSAAIVGPRHPIDRADHRPSNLGFVMIGAGLLWIGWNGFNGGDPYAASADAGVAVLNTNICAAMSLMTWTALDVLYFKKPAIIGSVNGMITGLVAITPAGKFFFPGVIPGWAAIVMGLISGSIPWCSMNLLGHRFFFRRVDDALGVVHTHMVAGFLGGFFTGIFATIDGCAAFGISNPGGAIDGNGRQVWVQVVGALFVIGWNLAVTPLILFFIQYVLRIPLKMKDEVLLIGDDAVHGEAAYTFEQMPLMERNGDIEEGTGSGSPMGSAEMQNRKNVDNERSHVRSEEVMA